MKIFYITIGAPRSGKSTWAEQKQQEDAKQGIVTAIINRDDIRRELYGFVSWADYKFTKEREKAVTEVCDELFSQAFDVECNVICSDTNINPSTRQRLCQMAENNGYRVEEVHFDVPLHILEKRNALSAHGVQPDVLVDMWQRYQQQFGYKYVPNTNNPITVIFDIDGTLACHKGVRSPFEWDKVHLDKPKQRVIQLLIMYKTMMNYKVIIMSGRDGSCRALTEQWLKEHFITYDELLMRPAGSQEPDYRVKRDLFDQVKDKYNIVLAVDDRDQIVNLWRSMGIETFQVDYGKF